MNAVCARTLSAPDAPSAWRILRRSYPVVTCSRRRSRRARRRRSGHSASGPTKLSLSVASARRRRPASVSAIAKSTLAWGVGGVKPASPLAPRRLTGLVSAPYDPPATRELRPGFARPPGGRPPRTRERRARHGHLATPVLPGHGRGSRRRQRARRARAAGRRPGAHRQDRLGRARRLLAGRPDRGRPREGVLPGPGRDRRVPAAPRGPGPGQGGGRGAVPDRRQRRDRRPRVPGHRRAHPVHRLPGGREPLHPQRRADDRQARGPQGQVDRRDARGRDHVGLRDDARQAAGLDAGEGPHRRGPGRARRPAGGPQPAARSRPSSGATAARSPSSRASRRSCSGSTRSPRSGSARRTTRPTTTSRATRTTIQQDAEGALPGGALHPRQPQGRRRRSRPRPSSGPRRRSSGRRRSRGRCSRRTGC